MPASQQQITSSTPMGATPMPGGATFRIWAPAAVRVHLASQHSGWQPADANLLVKDAAGFWTGFWPNFQDGDEYKFYVVGTGSSGHKRDPYARELTTEPPFPRSNCIVRDPSRYPWHDADFRPPDFHQLIIYQLHI